jgi:putative selenate reductase
LSCSKCVPACPNDAVFEVEIEPFIGEMPVIEIECGAWREVGRRLYRALKPTQIAIFADACNDCGNCDVFCPEDGGPHIEKPRFFGSFESWRRAAPLSGFVITKEGGAVVLRGRMTGGEFALTHAPDENLALLETETATVVLDWGSHEVVSAELREPRSPSPESRIPSPVSPAVVDLSPYMTLRLLLDALAASRRVNFVNAALVE